MLAAGRKLRAPGDRVPSVLSPFDGRLGHQPIGCSGRIQWLGSSGPICHFVQYTEAALAPPLEFQHGAPETRA